MLDMLGEITMGAFSLGGAIHTLSPTLQLIKISQLGPSKPPKIRKNGPHILIKTP